MTTDTPQSAAVKALRYAEEQLGVNTVYAEARGARTKLDQLMTELGEARDQKRVLERLIADREMAILFDETSKHPGMSVAAMDRHLKLEYHADAELKGLRKQHVDAVNDLDGLELDRSVLEVDIKIAVARMHELGGYLQYLAVVKQQSQ